MIDHLTASRILTLAHIDKATDFHALRSDQVAALVDAANEHKYRKPKNANGSTGRYFHAYLLRRINGKRTEFIVQGNYGAHGWEDEAASDTYREAREDLKAYRDNGPGQYRLIRRRVPVSA
jgi:hypothetical protein